MNSQTKDVVKYTAEDQQPNVVTITAGDAIEKSSSGSIRYVGQVHSILRDHRITGVTVTEYTPWATRLITSSQSNMGVNSGTR